MAPWLSILFFLSGAAALIYQIVWQRALFGIYGLDITSVTVVVTAFMLGLGVGSLLGGILSRRYPRAVVPLFAASELGIGSFGFFSLALFDAVAGFTSGIGHLMTGLVAFGLVVLPTTLMGATLPLLVSYGTARFGNVGHSVGTLYFVNTLGAAAGALIAATFLMGRLGLGGTIELTAALNVGLGLAVVLIHRLGRQAA